jgi:centromeric protein E
MKCLQLGERKRRTAETGMNERSSRSHAIFRLIIESRPLESTSVDDGVLMGVLNLVDLAGSESVRTTHAEGSVKIEAGKINQSLLTLSRVIKELADHSKSNSKGKSHVSFRDSKLTRVLQPSLDGNTKLAVICCISPSSQYIEETKSTLKFASSAKDIKLTVKRNEVVGGETTMQKMQVELAALRKQLEQAKMGKNDDSVKQTTVASNSELTDVISKYEAEIAELRRMVFVGGSVAREAAQITIDWNEDDTAAHRLMKTFEMNAKGRGKRHRETWCPSTGALSLLPSNFSLSNVNSKLSNKGIDDSISEMSKKSRKNKTESVAVIDGNEKESISSMDELLVNIEKLKSENSVLLSQNENLMFEKETLVNQVSLCTKTIVDLENNVASLLESNQDYISKMEVVENKLEESTRLNSAILADLQLMKQQKQALETTLVSFRDYKENSEKATTELQSSLSNLTSQLTESSINIKALEDAKNEILSQSNLEKSRLMVELDKSARRLKLSEELLEDSNAKNASLSSSLELSEKAISLYKEEINGSNVRINLLSDNVKTLQLEMDVLKQEKSSFEKEYSVKVKQLEKEVDLLEDKLDQSHKEIRELLTAYDDAEAESNKLASIKEADHQSQITSLQSKITLSDSICAELNTKLDSFKNEHEFISNAILDVNAMFVESSITQPNTNLGELIAEIKVKVGCLLEKERVNMKAISELTESKSELTEAVKSINVKCTDIQEQLNDATVSLSEKVNSIATLESELKSLKVSLDEVKILQSTTETTLQENNAKISEDLRLTLQQLENERAASSELRSIVSATADAAPTILAGIYDFAEGFGYDMSGYDCHFDGCRGVTGDVPICEHIASVVQSHLKQGVDQFVQLTKSFASLKVIHDELQTVINIQEEKLSHSAALLENGGVKISSLEELIVSKDAALLELKSSLRKANESRSQLSEEFVALEQKHADALTLVSELSTSNKTITEKYESVTAEYDAVCAKCNELSDNVNRLEVAMVQKQNEMTESETNFSRSLNDMEMKACDLEVSNASLRVDIDNLKNSFDELSKQYLQLIATSDNDKKILFSTLKMIASTIFTDTSSLSDKVVDIENLIASSDEFLISSDVKEHVMLISSWIYERGLEMVEFSRQEVEIESLSQRALELDSINEKANLENRVLSSKLSELQVLYDTVATAKGTVDAELMQVSEQLLVLKSNLQTDESTFFKLQENNAQLLAQVEAKETSIFALQDKMLELEMSVSTVTAEKESLSAVYSTLKLQLAESNQLIQSLQQEVTTLKEDCLLVDQYRSKVKESEELVSAANSARDLLANTVVEKTIQITESNNLINDLQQECKLSKNHIAALMATIDEQKTSITNLSSELMKLKSELLDLPNLRSSLKESQDRSESLLQQLHTIADIARTKENEALDAIAAQERLSMEVATLTASNDRLSSSLIAEKSQSSTLLERLSAMESIAIAAQDALVGLQSNAANMVTNALSGKESELSRQKELVSELQAQVQIKSESMNSLLSQLNLKSAELDALNSLVNKQEESIRSMSSEIDALRSDLVASRKLLQTSDATVAEQHAEINGLTRRLEATKSALDENEGESNKLRARVEKLEKTKLTDAQVKRLMAIKTERDALKIQCEKLISESKSHSSQIQAPSIVSTEVKELQGRIASLESSSKSSSEAAAKIRARLEEDLEDSRASCDELRNSLREMNGEVERFKTMTSELRLSLDELMSDQSKMNIFVAGLSSSITSTMQAITDYSMDVGTNKSDPFVVISKARELLDEITSKYNSLLHVHKESEKKFASIECSMNSRVSSLENEVKAASMKASDWESAYVDSDRKINALEEDLHKSRTELESNSNSLRVASDRIAELERANQELNLRLKERTKALGDHQTSQTQVIHSLEKENSALLVEVRQLRSQISSSSNARPASSRMSIIPGIVPSNPAANSSLLNGRASIANSNRPSIAPISSRPSMYRSTITRPVTIPSASVPPIADLNSSVNMDLLAEIQKPTSVAPQRRPMGEISSNVEKDLASIFCVDTTQCQPKTIPTSLKEGIPEENPSECTQQ